jgi:hypothetical protein
MRVIMFQDRFAEAVRDGSKTQTIRKSARCSPGDLLSLRRWSGLPYRSKQEVIVEARCISTATVEIWDIYGRGLTTVGGSGVYAEDLAQADGFGSFDEMLDWFRGVHGAPFGGLPFCGWLIRWEVTR